MRPARVIPRATKRHDLPDERVQSPTVPVFVPMRRRLKGNVSTESQEGPICWLCGYTVQNPINSAKVHKYCASKKISIIRNVNHTWYSGSFALEASLTRLARDWMGSFWKGVIS